MKSTREILDGLKQDVQRNVISHAVADLEQVRGASGRFEPGQEMSLGEAIKEVGIPIWEDLKQTGIDMFNHGRTELAAGILGQYQGHVMYMHSEKEVDRPLHGPEHQQEDHEREM